MQGRNVHRNGRAVFLLSAEGFISAVSTQRAARGKMGPGDLLFTTRAELMRVTAEWSIGRLVRAWNNIPQSVPLKRFANRQKAVERIWDAVQTLKPIRSRRTDAVGAENRAIKARLGTKKANVLALLAGRDGATVREIAAALNWKPESVRSCLSSLSRQGATVHTFCRPDGERAYSTQPPVDGGVEARAISASVESVRRASSRWTFLTRNAEWNVTANLRLSPAPKVGGWAGKQLRFLSVDRGESVITDVDPASMAILQRRAGLPSLQRMWFHHQGFSLGYTKPRGSAEPAELFFFDAEARISRQEYLSAAVIEASAGTDQWFLACRDGKVYAFSLEGRPLWNKLIPHAPRDNSDNELWGLPTFHPRLRIAAADALLAVGAEQEFHVYQRSGQRIWSKKIRETSSSGRAAIPADLPTREQRLATIGLSNVERRQQIRTAYIRFALDTFGDYRWVKPAHAFDIAGAWETESEAARDVSPPETSVELPIALPFTPGISVLRATGDAIVTGTQDGFVHVFDGQGTLQRTFQVGDSAVSDVVVSAQGLQAGFCTGRLTLFDGSQVSAVTELPEDYAELTLCAVGVLAWKHNWLRLVDRAGVVQFAAETDRPIRGVWADARGFYVLGSDLVSFALPPSGGHRRQL